MKSSVDFQLKKFKLPPRYQNIEWGNLQYVTEAEKAFATKYITDFPEEGRFPDGVKESIFLSNKVSGTGKTSFAVCLTKDLIRSGKLNCLPLYVSFRVLMEQMRQDKDESFLESEAYRLIIGASFVIFDDVGVERVTSSVADRYILLLEQLWLYRKPAIFTSKFTIQNFIERGAASTELEILESIGSRLIGMCVEYELSNEEDYRNGR